MLNDTSSNLDMYWYVPQAPQTVFWFRLVVEVGLSTKIHTDRLVHNEDRYYSCYRAGSDGENQE